MVAISTTTPTLDEPIRFGASPALLSPDVVGELLDRRRELDRVYDPRLAYMLSIVSGWAYADEHTLARKLRYYGLDGVTVEPLRVVNDAMLVVANAFFIRSRSGELGILAFRGTEPLNLINWLTDGNVTWHQFLYGRVHAGFFGNVEVLWEDIGAKLWRATQPGGDGKPANGDGHGEARRPLRALYVTGHSLGAAMAVITAARLLGDTEAPFAGLLRGVYTYGQPMVGDATFAAECARLLDGRLFRHVFARDLVCRMPSKLIDSGFVHFGEERFAATTESPWTTSDELRAKPATLILTPVLSALGSYITRRIGLLRASGLLRWLDRGYSIDDHGPTNYVEASRTTLVRR